jgi:hypothetical protein
MVPTRHEAATLLDDVERVLARTRRAIVAAHVADHFIVWGLAWMVGFGAAYASSWHEGWIWAVVASSGAVLSTLIGLRSGHSIESRDRRRIFWFFAILALFGAVWAVILHPFNARHLGAYIGTVFMFAYVAGGLWFGRFFVMLGLGVTAVALIGVLMLPAHLDLLMAVAGGGALLTSGLHIRRSWT